MSYTIKEASTTRHKESRNIENVLVMQGGGSLGAFACGVFKALVKHKVQIDIVAGTSIGAVNPATQKKTLKTFGWKLVRAALKLYQIYGLMDGTVEQERMSLRPFHPLQ